MWLRLFAKSRLSETQKTQKNPSLWVGEFLILLSHISLSSTTYKKNICYIIPEYQWTEFWCFLMSLGNQYKNEKLGYNVLH